MQRFVQYFVLSVLGLPLLLVGATGAGAQECTWCVACPYIEDHIMDHEDPDVLTPAALILEINLACEDYDCDDAMQCAEQEDSEDDLLALKEMIEDRDSDRLRLFTAENSEKLEIIPHRGLMMYRGGCVDQPIALLELPAVMLRDLSAVQ